MSGHVLAVEALMLAIPIAPRLAKGEKIKFVLSELGFTPKHLHAQLKQGIILFAVSFAVIALEVAALAAVGVSDAHKVEKALAQQPLSVLALVVLLAPVAEEVFFRGFLQKRVGVFIASAAFAGLHYGFGSAAEIIAAFTAALIFGGFVRRNNLLLPAIIAHALFNAYAVASVLKL